MGAINAMTSYQKTFGLTGEGSSTGIIFIIYNCKTPSSIIISPVNTTDISTYRWSDCRSVPFTFLDCSQSEAILIWNRIAFPFCGFLADGYGRRICIFVGCFLVLVGTAVQTTAHETGQFIGGRFILGFGGKHVERSNS